MDAFLAALRNKGTLEHILELLPPPTSWTSEFLSSARDGINVLRAKGLYDVAAVLDKLLLKDDLPAAEDAEMQEATDTDSESIEDPYYGLKDDAGGSGCKNWDRDKQTAIAEAREKNAYLCERYHIANGKFARYFRITESRDREDDTKCACWTPCAKVADIMGFSAGQDLAGNGTQFKAMCIDTEFVGRFVADHVAWLDARGIETADIPLRVARRGMWPDNDAFVEDAREARMCVIRYVTEVKLVISQLRDIFAALDSASASGGVDAVLGVIDGLDKRKRGRDDQLKLPLHRMADEDDAFARELLPPDQCRGAAANGARRVLSIIHSLRILAWMHTDEPFPGRAVLNSAVVLNIRTKWEEGRERRIRAAERIIVRIEQLMEQPPAEFIGTGFKSPARAASDALAAAAAVPRELSFKAISAMPFVVVEPAGLELRPFRDPAPKLLAGKFTARQHRAPCEASVQPPEVFELCEREPADPNEPLHPRCQGITVHDTVGQWVQAPGYVKFRQPEVIVEALAAASDRFRQRTLDLAELIAKEAIGFDRVPPAASYSHVVPKRSPGTPFEPISNSASLDEYWRSCHANPRILLRGVFRKSARAGGRPRKNSPEATTHYIEESTIAFACWLHYFIETKRGWLVAPRRFEDEEPLCLFVLMYDDLSITALSQQASFMPGGACALDRPAHGSVSARDTYVRMDFELSEENQERILGGHSDVCASLVEPGVIAIVLPVSVTSAAAERAIASWTSAADMHTASTLGMAAWLQQGGYAAETLRIAATGTCRSIHVMPLGWDPESTRVHLSGIGEMAAFMIAEMTIAELGITRSGGASAGCLRDWNGDRLLEMFDARAATAVRRAIFETYLLLTGGDFEFDKRCADLGISQHEYPEAAALIRTPSASRHRTEQLTKNNLVRKISGMGGTIWSLDADTVIRPLLERNSKSMVLKSDGGPDADACKYYQLEGVTRGPCIFSARRLKAGEPIYRGDKLWRYIPRFHEASESAPRQVPGEPMGTMAVSNDLAARRMKGIIRTLVGCFGSASSGADTNCSSFGRQFQPAYRRTLLRTAPPTWAMVESDFCFRVKDAAAVKGLKMLGPHFLYALFAYPDNPKNEHWPFYRQVRPLLAQGRRLATPDDVVVQSMGIAGRAFDIPPPLDHPSIAQPVIVDAATERAFEESRKAFPAAYIRVFMYGPGSGSGSGSTQVGRWRVVDLVPGLPPVALTVFEALRRSRLDSLSELDRAMCSHVVARACCSSEAAACASSPPPGGTAAYRDWRDRLCASAVERCMRQLAEAAIAVEAPTTLAGETCAAARGRAMVAAQDAGKLIGRWMSFSEAESFVDAAACAAAAAACACRQTDAAGKQHVLDMLDAVMRMNLSKPVGVSSPDARLAAFYTIHDALVVSMTNDPIDAHPSPTRIKSADGRFVVAVRAKRGSVPMHTANRLRWQSIAKMRSALAGGSLDRKDLLFGTRDGLVEASDFQPRTFVAAIRPNSREDVTSTPVSSPVIIPQYVRAFPALSVAHPGARRMEISFSAYASGGDMRMAENSIGAAYELDPPAAVRTMLPLGMQVLAVYFFDRPLRLDGAKRFKIRLDGTSRRLRSFACSPLPQQQTEHAMFVTFGRSNVYARLEFSENLVDTIYLFLPPSRVV